jgi:hypothetical protein
MACSYWQGLRWLPFVAGWANLAAFIVALKLLTADSFTDYPRMENAAIATVRVLSSACSRLYCSPVISVQCRLHWREPFSLSPGSCGEHLGPASQQHQYKATLRDAISRYRRLVLTALYNYMLRILRCIQGRTYDNRNAR